MSKIFYYELTAFADKLNVNKLQDELTSAINNNQAFSLSRIFKLLPLTIGNANDLTERDVISITDHTNLANSGDSSVQISFSDPALGNFFLNVPSEVKAKAHVLTGSLTIDVLNLDLTLKLDKIAQEGYNRSAFQIVTKFIFDHSNFTTILMDMANNNFLTYMHVKLDNSVASNISQNFNLSSEIQKEVVANSITTYNFKGFASLGVPCFGEDDDKKYIVARQKNTKICFVRESSWIVGGQIGYEQVGPTFDSESEANDWENNAPECNY